MYDIIEYCYANKSYISGIQTFIIYVMYTHLTQSIKCIVFENLDFSKLKRNCKNYN